MTSLIKKVETTEAPAAIGPYSQAVLVPPNLVFVSGMLPIDPTLNRMIEGDIRLLTRQVIINLEAVLKGAGSHLHNVVKTEIFLIDLANDFAGMNAEYAVWFTGQVAPARQTIQVAKLPLNSRIEISCIAVIN
jgi:2-iminobutanoate/2-iminopropanoate deaminase